jgi:hypothetical protein
MKYSALAALLAISLSSLVCVTALDCYEAEFKLASRIEELERTIRDEEYAYMYGSENSELIDNLFYDIDYRIESLSSEEANNFLGEVLYLSQPGFRGIDNDEFSISVSKVHDGVDLFNSSQTSEEKLDALYQLKNEYSVLRDIISSYIDNKRHSIYLLNLEKFQLEEDLERVKQDCPEIYDS